MINTVRKHYLSLIWSPLSILVYCIFVFRTFSMGGTFQNFSWEELLLGLSDQYYILYLLLPYYCYRLFKQQSTYLFEQVIRFSSFFRYFLFYFFNQSLFAAGLVSMHILIFIPFLLVNGQLTNVNFSEPIRYYTEFFPNAFIAAIVSAAYLIFGLTIMSLTLMFCYVIFKKYISFTVTILMILVPIAALRWDWTDNLFLLFINNYLILPHMIETPWKLTILICFAMLLTSFLLIMIKKYWFIQLSLRIPIRFNWYLSGMLSRKNSLFLIGIILLLVVLYDLSETDRHFDLLLLNDFIGYGTGYFSLMEYLKYLLKMCVPLFVIGAFLEKELNGRSSIVTIRLESYQSWWRQIQKNIASFIGLYALAYYLVSIASALLLQSSYQAYLENQTIPAFEDFHPLLLAGISCLLMMLELLFLQLLFFCMYHFFRNLYLSFIVVIFGYMLILTGWKIINYVPWGLSSIKRFHMLGGNIMVGATVSGVILLFGSLILYVVISRRMLKTFF